LRKENEKVSTNSAMCRDIIKLFNKIYSGGISSSSSSFRKAKNGQHKSFNMYYLYKETCSWKELKNTIYDPLLLFSLSPFSAAFHHFFKHLIGRNKNFLLIARPK